MKKLLSGMAILCFGLSFANGTNEFIKSNDSKTQLEDIVIFTGDWGCEGTLSMWDDWSGEYIVIKRFSVCCYDTPQEACGAVEQELETVAQSYN